MPSATASQTIGPFWHLLEHPEWADLTRFGAAGERVSLIGSVVDGDGSPVTDAAVELWQADPPTDDRFPGFGRCRTDEHGEFRFTTVKPGAVPGRGRDQHGSRPGGDPEPPDGRPANGRVTNCLTEGRSRFRG